MSIKTNGKFAVIAGLMSLAMAGCAVPTVMETQGAATAGGEEPPKVQSFTEDGIPLIDVTIGLQGDAAQRSNSVSLDGPDGSLSKAIAKSYNYMEAVFVVGGTTSGKFYAKAARLPNELKVTIPAVTYSRAANDMAGATSNYGCLLAGDYNNGDPILFALGEFTGTTCAPTAASPSIAFNLYALESDIRNATDVTDLTAGASVKTALFEGVNTPYISGLPSGTGGAANEKKGKIKIRVGGNSILYGIKKPSGGTGFPAEKMALTPYNMKNPETLGIPSSAFTPSTGRPLATITPVSNWIIYDFGFQNAAAINPGLVTLSYDIPVMGLHAEFSGNPAVPTKNKDAVVWHIKGGLQPASIDFGATTDGGSYASTGSTANNNDSLGGGILLEIGGTLLTPFTVTVGTGP